MVQVLWGKLDDWCGAEAAGEETWIMGGVANAVKRALTTILIILSVTLTGKRNTEEDHAPDRLSFRELLRSRG